MDVQTFNETEHQAIAQGILSAAIKGIGEGYKAKGLPVPDESLMLKPYEKRLFAFIDHLLFYHGRGIYFAGFLNPDAAVHRCGDDVETFIEAHEDAVLLLGDVNARHYVCVVTVIIEADGTFKIFPCSIEDAMSFQPVACQPKEKPGALSTSAIIDWAMGTFPDALIGYQAETDPDKHTSNATKLVPVARQGRNLVFPFWDIKYKHTDALVVLKDAGKPYVRIGSAMSNEWIEPHEQKGYRDIADTKAGKDPERDNSLSCHILAPAGLSGLYHYAPRLISNGELVDLYRVMGGPRLPTDFRY